MLRLSLDRCQEIQSYGSHSNHNLATPSPTSTTTLLKHIGLKLFNRHQREGKLWEAEIARGTSWRRCRRGGLCLSPRGESTASGSTRTEWPLPKEKHRLILTALLCCGGKLGTDFTSFSSVSTSITWPSANQLYSMVTKIASIVHMWVLSQMLKGTSSHHSTARNANVATTVNIAQQNYPLFIPGCSTLHHCAPEWTLKRNIQRTETVISSKKNIFHSTAFQTQISQTLYVKET